MLFRSGEGQDVVVTVRHFVGGELLVFFSNQIISALIDQQIALEGRLLVKRGHAGFEAAVSRLDVAIAVVDADDDRRIVIQNVHKILSAVINSKRRPVDRPLSTIFF